MMLQLQFGQYELHPEFAISILPLLLKNKPFLVFPAKINIHGFQTHLIITLPKTCMSECQYQLFSLEKYQLGTFALYNWCIQHENCGLRVWPRSAGYIMPQFATRKLHEWHSLCICNHHIYMLNYLIVGGEIRIQTGRMLESHRDRESYSCSSRVFQMKLQNQRNISIIFPFSLIIKEYKGLNFTFNSLAFSTSQGLN